MNNIKFLLLGTSLSLIPNLTFAQCVATQDCETLGYTETSCNGGKGVKCPFGNKWACFKSDSECEQQFCDKYGFQYTCSGTGYSGGGGELCNNKYAFCSCSDGYIWKDNNCQKQEVLNGEDGEFYRCNGNVVGVRITGMNFYVAMKDLGNSEWEWANSGCSSYIFCGKLVKGTLPSKDQLLTIYNNKSRINTLLSNNGGQQLTNNKYWSSSWTGTSLRNDFYNTIDMSNGTESSSGDYDSYYVRPVLTTW